jgi:hypothetical protein
LEKKMKKTFTTVGLAMVMAAGSTFANAGIIVAGRAEQPMDETYYSEATTKVRSCDQSTGIIVAGSAGIIVAGFAGLDVDTFMDDVKSSATCTEDTGIIVAGSTGIIVAG